VPGEVGDKEAEHSEIRRSGAGGEREEGEPCAVQKCPRSPLEGPGALPGLTPNHMGTMHGRRAPGRLHNAMKSSTSSHLARLLLGAFLGLLSY
jgi:hypothetical protein